MILFLISLPDNNNNNNNNNNDDDDDDDDDDDLRLNIYINTFFL